MDATLPLVSLLAPWAVSAALAWALRGPGRQAAWLTVVAGAVSCCAAAWLWLNALGGFAAQLSGAIGQITAGSQEQAEGVNEATGIVKRVSGAIAEVSSNARVGMEAWQNTASSAAEGARMTHETVAGMGKVKSAMDLVSVRVTDLGERSGEIGKIVATIDDIASQTNLLALNAAIEAARQSLAMASSGELKGIDMSPAFEVLQEVR